MRPLKDSRINIKIISIKDSVLLFFALAAINGIHMLIYLKILKSEGRPTQFLATSLVIYLLGVTLFLSILVGVIRYYSFSDIARRLGKATRKIARGDFSVRVVPLRKDGKKDNIEVMFDDFNTMAKELQSIETMKNDFIANVSHEIKTPLSVIQSYAMALENDALGTEERHDYIKTIVVSSQKLSALVSNILKLDKLENQEIIPAASSYELGEQIRRLALLFEDLWERKNISFDADLDEVIIRYDEDILEIVWNNLISNAVKFTPPGGSIVVTLRNLGDFAEVQITDSGCGMDGETQKHIFDKFYQADASHSQEGNGLGLALVKKVLEIIGGGITVTSKAGEGATFTVRLKTAYAQPQSKNY
jgi:signal transduction histidine kinase